MSKIYKLPISTELLTGILKGEIGSIPKPDLPEGVELIGVSMSYFANAVVFLFVDKSDDGGERDPTVSDLRDLIASECLRHLEGHV
jgi:hypothetical protein